MMEHIFTIVWLSIGVLIGGFGVWALLKTKVQTEYERGKSEANTEVSILRERVASRERELNQTTQTLQQHSADLERLRDELRSETERRAASEQHNTYIPTLKS